MKAPLILPIALGLLAHATVFAEPNGAKDRPIHKAWAMLDADQDGKLTPAEFQKLPRISQLPAEKQNLIFTRLDKNANGGIEKNELHSMGDAPQKDRFFPNLPQIDTNQDKQISFDEFIGSPAIKRLPAERQRKMFDNMDRNQDQFLSVLDHPEGKRPFKFGKRGDDSPENDKRKNEAGRPHPESRPNFAQLDKNQDSKLDFPEFQAAPIIKQLGEDAQEDRFEAIDANKDLHLSAEEWQQQPMRKPQPDADKSPKKPGKQPTPDAEEMMTE